jgi:peptidyl-prolyl cis-trans isomerase SurA
MIVRTNISAWTFTAILLALLAAPRVHAQGVLVDQVIAVVNSDLILESDIDEERRFEAFQPFRDPEGPSSRTAIIDRLIDRTLILQQAKLQPDDRVTLAEAETQLKTLRTEIPACKPAHCETDAGWEKFVKSEGFTIPQIEELWRQRMETLKFVEFRFRAGIRISPAEIKAYYDKTLAPEVIREKATPPPLDSVSERIQEILLQQRVGSLLNDWLTTLKAQGTVRIMKPGEEAP